MTERTTLPAFEVAPAEVSFFEVSDDGFIGGPAAQSALDGAEDARISGRR